MCFVNLFYVKTVETPSVVNLPQSLFSQHSVWQALVTFNGVVLESAVRIESVAMWRPALSYTFPGLQPNLSRGG